MLQCVAVCCSVLQCVGVCCSALECVAVRCSVLQCVEIIYATNEALHLEHRVINNYVLSITMVSCAMHLRGIWHQNQQENRKDMHVACMRV